jgi:putative tryptophan/tyrosine transport system substrate-binding protein
VVGCTVGLGSEPMSRRQFITLIAGTAAAWPLSVLAQVSHKRPVLVWLSGITQTGSSPSIAAFLKGMRELGYVEGSDFELLYRFSDGYADRIPSLAEEVVRLNPAVILATAVDTAVAARKLTSTIPIVTGALADPVHLGLIASEARPGGNVTGIEPYLTGLPAKQIELAREIVPSASKIGPLTNLQDPKAPPQAQELTAAAKALEIDIATADANRPEDIDGALHALKRQPVDIVIVLQTSMLLSERNQIIAWELANKLPMVFGYPQYTRGGGLVSYGVDLPSCYYRTAYFVDKILHGTAPGDLPVEFPSKLLLAINIKTAKALGITVPSSLLVRADEVIE